jgi:multidrug resistance efflux pump
MKKPFHRLAMLIFLPCLAATAVAQAPESRFAASADTAVIDLCRVLPAKDLEISASEPGKLMELKVKEGSRVEGDEEIGVVDDREAKMLERVAFYQLSQAKNQAEDKIDEEYSRAAHKVAEKEVERLKLANQIRPSAFTEVEVERAELEETRAGLAIKKAINDRTLATDEWYTKKAEYDAAIMAIERRKILAPNTGEVIKLYRQQGEWVNPGDPILRLVQLDVLYVQGDLSISTANYNPRDVVGCEVVVDLMIGGGQRAQAVGTITWVSPIALHKGEVFVREVRAEIANEWDGRAWKFYPGVDAKMTIKLGTADVRVSQNE